MALRMLRADRPSNAMKGKRKDEYIAGLKQAEQLWLSAAEIDPDARPILLFYGLTQAARALCVAGLTGDDWKTSPGHGLTCKVESPAESVQLDFEKVQIEPKGLSDSLLQRTARVLNSPVIETGSTLAELIASLENELFFDEDVTPGNRPLHVRDDWQGGTQDMNSPHFDRLIVGRVPEHLAQRQEQVPASPNNPARSPIIDPTPNEIAEWLAPYPTLAALGVPSDVRISNCLWDGGTRLDEYDAYLRWGDGTPTEGEGQLAWTLQYIDRLDPGAGERTQSVSGVVYPTLGGNDRHAHPLVVWWLILYALSMLARYHPRVWADALDLDNSRLAVPLRHLLDVAAEEAQRLVTEALIREHR